MIHLEMPYCNVNMDSLLAKDLCVALHDSVRMQWLDLTGFTELGNVITSLNMPQLNVLCIGECNVNKLAGLDKCISLEWLELNFVQPCLCS